MKFNNSQLQNFISRIKLKEENMPLYRDQMNNLKRRLSEKINNDDKTGVKVTKFIISGSWKKRTILRATGEHPIDVDLVLYVEGDESLKSDIERLHDFVVRYLSEIYPTKNIFRDVDAEGRTKSVKIKFIGTGLATSTGSLRSAVGEILLPPHPSVAPPLRVGSRTKRTYR